MLTYIQEHAQQQAKLQWSVLRGVGLNREKRWYSFPNETFWEWAEQEVAQTTSMSGLEVLPVLFSVIAYM